MLTTQTLPQRAIAAVSPAGSGGTRMQRSLGTGRIAAKKAFDGSTRLRDLFQEGSARIRLPKSHSEGRLQAVLLNTSGGMTGGDRLHWDCHADAGTHLTLATQTAERLYRASTGRAETTVRLRVEAGATLHWLAQETIAFDGSAFARSIECDLAADASLIVCEPLVFGRTAMGERIDRASIEDRWTIRRDDVPIHVEGLRLRGDVGSLVASAAGGANRLAHATILFVGAMAEALESRAKALIGEMGGASFHGGRLVARLMAPSAFELRRRLVPLLVLLRGGEALPRCWSI